jgi:vancomycin resistance protein YoaR
LIAVFFILADIIAFSYLYFEALHQNKIYPGVNLGQAYLGGKTESEARTIISAKVSNITENGIQFDFNQQEATITPIISTFDGDVTYQVITFNIDDMINRAFSIGRGHGVVANLAEQLESSIFGKKIPVSFTTDDNRIKEILANNFEQASAPAENSNIFATTTIVSGKKEIVLRATNEKPGFTINYDQAIQSMKNSLAKISNPPINLSSTLGSPSIKKSEIEPLLPNANNFLDQASLTLVYADKKWPVPEINFANWLTVSRASDSRLSLDIDKDKLSAYLDKTAATQIEIPVGDARFKIDNGRVVEFSKSQNGVKIDLDQTYLNLKNNFLTEDKNTVDIAVATVTSDIAENQINNLGITEIIGTGHSNFVGSPKNRIINIGVGAAAMNGLLIAPGTEFSTNKALGTVDAAAGYLPELSIIGNKTIPEYGGGLCQIGTTLFRAALASGLPITERQAHSYRVAYYEPAGTDATIYQPEPDFKFINDTKNYVLIQTHTSGNDLYFDFWGTKDGRAIEQTDPTISNIVKPLPGKLIETLSLPPGQKKCSEKAHNGADAFFDYKVTYPDGTIKQKRFTSHYVPWQEVCLIGVAQLSSTSTPSTIQPQP